EPCFQFLHGARNAERVMIARRTRRIGDEPVGAQRQILRMNIFIWPVSHVVRAKLAEDDPMSPVPAKRAKIDAIQRFFLVEGVGDNNARLPTQTVEQLE